MNWTSSYGFVANEYEIAEVERLRPADVPSERWNRSVGDLAAASEIGIVQAANMMLNVWPQR